MLTFESTHEYYIGPDASIYYCSEHEALIVSRDYEDRLLINGISKETMLSFAKKLVKKDLGETLAKYETEKVTESEKVDA